MTVDMTVWREVFAPTSGLVDQSPALREALKTLDVVPALAELERIVDTLPPEADRVVRGIMFYVEHIAANARERHKLATDLVDQARDFCGKELLADVRRAGNLVFGLASGRLTHTKYTEAHELAWSVLTPAVAETLMARIELHRLSPREWINARLNEARQILSMRGTGMPIIWKLRK